MAISTFIPEIWAARLLENYRRNLVFAALANRNWEGEIQQYGDTVHINSLADITVKEYTPNTDIDDPEQLSTTDQVLAIDHGAYFNFYVNDVDAVQARGDLMDAAMRNAAALLAEDTEDYIVDKIIEGATNKTTGALTKETIYEEIIKIKTAMDEKNVPRAGRHLVVPPSVEGLLLLDNRFVNTGLQASENRLVDGAVAKAAGFTIYVSNATSDKMVAFNSDAVTFANQIAKIEAYRREKGFDDGVKGLNMCGAKVVMPDAVFVHTITE